jgi:LytS/YehU family sensor histidine kinase
VALLFVVIVGGIYEGIYYFTKWNRASLEAERLQRQNLQTQLDSLKSQISPHFLFNSLSSLISLIMEDQKRAVLFAEELSVVYRYLLQANETTLTTVREEIRFAQAYYSLLQNRFEDSMRMEVNVEEGALDGLVSPLSLQLLLENAVKHNATLQEDPLCITIESKNGYLVVTNSLHPKNSPVPSNKVGLKNIAAKYELLGQPSIIVEKSTTHFIVKLPLINVHQHEYSDCGR